MFQNVGITKMLWLIFMYIYADIYMQVSKRVGKSRIVESWNMLHAFIFLGISKLLFTNLYTYLQVLRVARTQGWGYSSVFKFLSSISKALGSVPSTEIKTVQ